MIKRLRQHQKSGASAAGFTLIELLVVIVILGILAAVVVFAVRGSGDKGLAASVSTDARTIRTAEEAYCAQNGRYGSGQELINGGFLADLPQYHVVRAQSTGGPCNGWKFSMVATEQAGADSGSWALLDLPAGFDVQELRRMPDGAVVGFGRDSDGVIQTSLWEPSTGQWVAGDAFPDHPDQGTHALRSILVVTDDPLTPANECGQICNKILLKLIPQLDDDSRMGWYTFDPAQPSGSGTQWQELPRHPATPTFSTRAAFNMSPLVQLHDNPAVPGSQCGENCGKILVRAPDSGLMPDLYDPQTNIFTPFSWDLSVDRLLHTAVPLPDGRVLLAGFVTASNRHIKFFNPLTVQIEPGFQPSKAIRWTPGGSISPPVLPNGDVYLNIPWDNSILHPQIYTPQAGGNGVLRDTPPNCDPLLDFENVSNAGYCQILASLPDGRLLAASATGTQNPSVPGQDTGRAFVFEPDNDTWSRTDDTPVVNELASNIRSAVLLDPRSGPCEQHCNKVLVAGTGLTALYTP